MQNWPEWISLSKNEISSMNLVKYLKILDILMKLCYIFHKLVSLVT